MKVSIWKGLTSKPGLMAPGADIVKGVTRVVSLTPRQAIVFCLILMFKLVAATLFGSRFTHQLFIPFIDYFVASGFADPWEHFQSIAPDAFPYSGVMLAVLALPRLLLMPFLENGQVSGIHLLALRLPMLAADLAIWRVLVSWYPTRVNRTLLLYWCSPIVFYISYVHGQIDSIPTAFFVLSIAALLQERFVFAGLVYGAAVASKFHVLAILPFLILYIFKRANQIRPVMPDVIRFLVGALSIVCLGIAPFLFSQAYREMVLGEGESQAVFTFFLNITPFVKFYICPAVLIALLVKFSTYSKTNRDLLILYCGLIFASLVLFLPPAPGWYFWSIPFIAYFFIRQLDASFISYWVLSLTYISYYLVKDYSERQGGSDQIQFFLNSAFTVFQTTLAFIVFWIYQIGVRSNEEYKPVRKPLLIGIGGDSSTGKHTFANSLEHLMGDSNICKVNGDDYHKWPRGHESWKKVTHLNPQGNNLHLPLEHIRRLKRGQRVRKSSYDHVTGTFTLPVEVEPKHFILFLGLHPFYLPRMRAALDLKIFMETDEKLRTAWKVRRDAEKRGYSPDQVMDQIERRKPDGTQFIRPQRNFADLVIKYMPKDGNGGEICLDSGIFVQYQVWSDFYVEPLIEKLRMENSLEVSWDYLPDMERQELRISGSIGSHRIASIAYELLPNIEEIILNKPTWESNIRGLNQLMTVVVLSEQLQSPHHS